MKSSDGVIDGNGILKINPFVSFNVIFQCKRYKKIVGAAQIRDVRGAMMGRADKGIFMTTGIFTMEAKKEAGRGGVPPIERVDGEKLVDMFWQLEFGVKPITSYQADVNFFNEFRWQAITIADGERRDGLTGKFGWPPLNSNVIPLKKLKVGNRYGMIYCNTRRYFYGNCKNRNLY